MSIFSQPLRWLFGASLLHVACSPLLKANDFTFADAAPSPPTLPADSGEPALDVNGAVRISAPQPEGLFGVGVALAGDTLAVSAPFVSVNVGDGTVARAGAVYLYDLTTGTSPYRTIVMPNADEGDGVLPPELVADNVQIAPFSWGAMSLALSDDWLVVGVPAEASVRQDDPLDNSAPYSGAVYVYNRAAPDSRPQYIKAPNAKAGDVFGGSVSLSGSLLAIGASRQRSGDRKNPNDDSAPLSGAVYVYSLDATGSFANPTYVKAPEIAKDAGFGFSVSVSDDLLVVGAPGENTMLENIPLSSVGAVHVFRRTAGGWQLEQSLRARNPQPSGFFGFSVSSISAGSFVVGGTGEKDCEYGGGATTTGRGDAYRVHQTNGQWIEDCVVPNSGIAQVIFGFSVAAGGGRYAVGAPYDSSGVVDDPSDKSMGAAGAAYLFAPEAAAGKKQYVKPPHPRPSGFGYSLALGSDRLVVGAPYEGDPAGDSGVGRRDGAIEIPRGAVYLFDLN
jgi:hypothetical protein